MNRRRFYKTVFAIVSVLVIAIGGFGQGKGHGGGNPHGGGGNPHGGGNGGGQPQRQAPQRAGGDHGHGNPHGNGGDQQRQVLAQQRALQEQQRAAQQQQWQQQRAIQQQQRAAQQQQWQQQRVLQQQQQRQTDWAARMQQRQNDQNFRRQQHANQQQFRQQQEALRQQFRQQYVPPQVIVNNHDNGLHRGWTDNGPRGNAYGLRGMAPGQNRDLGNGNAWTNQQIPQPRYDPNGDRRSRATTYYTNNNYYYDPLARWAPQIYQSYSSVPNTYSSGSNNYGYNYPLSYSYSAPRETFVRTLISSFFVPDQYDYTTFYAPPYYSSSYYGSSGPYSYAPSGYYYSSAGYGSNYYDPYYANDPYYYDYYNGGVPMFASPFYGDNSLKASLLNFGVQLLRSMLGQGYRQGLNDAEYVRVVQGPVYYDPYQAPEPAYYSPYVSSFADQRQIFEQGYQLGYEDAMRNQDPYAIYNNNARVDVVSQFLANSLLGS